MSYRSGDIFYEEFTSNNISGAVFNFDVNPLGVFAKNGVDDLNVKVFTTNIDIGRYVASGLIPNYSLPAACTVTISGYMNGLLTKGALNLGALQNPVSITGSLPAVIVQSGGMDQVIIDGNTNLRQAISAMSSVIAGSSIVNGNQITYFALNNNSIQRVNSTAISGARQSIVLFLP